MIAVVRAVVEDQEVAVGQRARVVLLNAGLRQKVASPGCAKVARWRRFDVEGLAGWRAAARQGNRVTITQNAPM